ESTSGTWPHQHEGTPEAGRRRVVHRVAIDPWHHGSGSRPDSARLAAPFPEQTPAQSVALQGKLSEDGSFVAITGDHTMHWLGGFSLDVKLGGRMLVKYPGL